MYVLLAQGGLMACGPKPLDLQLSQVESTHLQALVCRCKAGLAFAQRARIVLAYADLGSVNSSIARTLCVSRMSVTAWRARLLAQCLDSFVTLLRLKRITSGRSTKMRRLLR